MAIMWKSCCVCIPQRWVIVLMCFSGLFNAYAMRVCLSIAITQMAYPVNNTEEFSDDTCPDNNNYTEESNVTVTEHTELYDWSEYTQGVILSSFYAGYVFTNLLGGQIAERIGGKHTLGINILSTAIFTLLTPYSAFWGGATALIFLRIVMGLGEGTTYPSISVLLAQWIPEDERSKAGALALSGAPLGTIFGTLVSGVILRYSPMGWPAVFYFYGLFGIASFFINAALCYSKPSEHPFILGSELDYLKKKLNNTHTNLPSTPWSYILRSKPVWALVLAVIGNGWGFITVVSDMPKYMSSVLKFSVQNNGYLSSVPYLAMWIGSLFASWIVDIVISKGVMSISRVRKIGNTIASLGPGIFIVLASYAGCDGSLFVVLLTIGLTLLGCSHATTMVNVLDLGPNYAGSIMGLVNGISTIGCMISPNVVGLLTPNQTISEWRLVFWIILILFVVTNLIYEIYGSGELQDWNDPAFLEREKRMSKASIKEGVQLLQMKEIKPNV